MSESYDHDQQSWDVCLDSFLTLPQVQREALARWLRPLCDQPDRRRGRGAEGDRILTLTIGMIVANTLRSAAHPRGPATHYSRTPGTYSRGNYHPHWLGYDRFMATLDALVAAGLLIEERAPPGERFNPRQSTMRASAELLDELKNRGIATQDVERDSASAPVLFLKDAEKRLVRYNAADPEIARMDSQVRAYNAFLRDQELTWDIPQEVRDGLWNRGDRRGRPYAPPSLGDTDLRRVFNASSWQLGGRFFGGWWQTVPSGTRRFIRINEEETVELDFGGFLPRAAYHLRNLEFEGDPYDIPELRFACEAEGLDWAGIVRPSIKTMVSVVLCSTRLEGREGISGLVLPKGYSKRSVYILIEQIHSPICESFYKGIGLELMRVESSVCSLILDQAMDYGIPILPVHDSFVCQADCKDWLKDNMDLSYRHCLGHHPVIH